MKRDFDTFGFEADQIRVIRILLMKKKHYEIEKCILY